MRLASATGPAASSARPASSRWPPPMRWMRWPPARRPSGQGVVARIDWQQLKPLHEARRPRPFLKHGAAARGDGSPRRRAPRRGRTTPAGRTGPAGGGGTSQPAPRPARRLRRAARSPRCSACRTADRCRSSTGLFDLGMDSLMSVELKRRLERGAGQPLPSTLTFNYPNVGALAASWRLGPGPVGRPRGVRRRRRPIGAGGAPGVCDARSRECQAAERQCRPKVRQPAVTATAARCAQRRRARGAPDRARWSQVANEPLGRPRPCCSCSPSSLLWATVEVLAGERAGALLAVPGGLDPLRRAPRPHAG